MVTRGDIVQSMLDLFEAPSYLEIGVDHGLTFNSVVAQHKYAVDPDFKFGTHVMEIAGRSVLHFALTSDAYFAGPCASRVLDVAFIDGLHTFEQTLRDLLNVQAHLQRHGVIVIDDVNPSSFHASLPDVGEAFRVRDYQARYHPEMANNLDWMGDVYKLVFFIQTFMQSWTYATVDETRGQLVMWPAVRPVPAVGGRSFAQVSNLGYRDVVFDQAAFNFQPLADIVAQVRAAMPGQP